MIQCCGYEQKRYSQSKCWARILPKPEWRFQLAETDTPRPGDATATSVYLFDYSTDNYTAGRICKTCGCLIVPISLLSSTKLRMYKLVSVTALTVIEQPTRSRSVFKCNHSTITTTWWESLCFSERAQQLIPSFWADRFVGVFTAVEQGPVAGVANNGWVQ